MASVVPGLILAAPDMPGPLDDLGKGFVCRVTNQSPS